MSVTGKMDAEDIAHIAYVPAQQCGPTVTVIMPADWYLGNTISCLSGEVKHFYIKHR